MVACTAVSSAMPAMVARNSSLGRPQAGKAQLAAPRMTRKAQRSAQAVRAQAGHTSTLVAPPGLGEVEIKDKNAELAINGGSPQEGGQCAWLGATRG